jgi:hypothetical protein
MIFGLNIIKVKLTAKNQKNFLNILLCPYPISLKLAQTLITKTPRLK